MTIRPENKLALFFTGLVGLFVVLNAQAAVLVQNPQANNYRPAKLLGAQLYQSPSVPYHHGQPTDQAQYILELINQARANPALEGLRLANLDDPDILRAYRWYAIDTNLLIQQFATYQVQPPLGFNAALLQAAIGHGQDMKENDFQGHVSSDGSGLDDRLTASGYLWSRGGENVYAYAYTLMYAHAGMIVDWGVDDLGHRNVILNIDDRADFREIGIAVLEERDPDTDVGPLIVVEDFGQQLDDMYAFVTGVVYQDLNGNRFYDVGEGIQGITITPDRGIYYAVSSSSGGYTIPVVPDNQSYQITATGFDNGSEVVKTRIVSEQNVKLDFVVIPGVSPDNTSDSSGTGNPTPDNGTDDNNTGNGVDNDSGNGTGGSGQSGSDPAGSSPLCPLATVLLLCSLIAAGSLGGRALQA